MNAQDIFTFGPGLKPPWRVTVQHLNQQRQPNDLWLELTVEPGAVFPRPKCGCVAKPHHWKEGTSQYLNFF